MRIWKWPLQIAVLQTLQVPVGAEVLTVQLQGDKPQLWAIVNEHAATQPRSFAIYGTGHPMPEQPGFYIATFQTHDGALVWHVFEVCP